MCWLHPATKNANVCCTTKLCLPAVWNSLPATLPDSNIQAPTENVLICSMMNTIRRGCCGGVFSESGANIRLLTYLLTCTYLDVVLAGVQYRCDVINDRCAVRPVVTHAARGRSTAAVCRQPHHHLPVRSWPPDALPGPAAER